MSDLFSSKRVFLGAVVAYLTAGGSALGAVVVPLAADLFGWWSEAGHGLGELGQLFGGMMSGGALGLLLGLWLVIWGVRLLKKVIIGFTLFALGMAAGALLLVQQGVVTW